MTDIHGLVPILATPFNARGELDERGLRRLVGFQLASEVDGIGIHGMASEAFALDDDERDRILAVVEDEVAGQVPVVVGAGGTALRPAIAQARRAAAGGADALMVMAPSLVKHSPEQLVEFFAELAQASGVPVMVQDAPAVTGVALTPDLVARICSEPGVNYVKTEAQPTAPWVASAVEALDGRAHVLGGQNSLFLLEEYDRGAVGTMPASEMTDLLRTILDAYSLGDQDHAREQFNRLLPLLRYGLQPGLAWAVHKHVLVERGIIANPFVRAPAKALDRQTEQGLKVILDDLKLSPVPATAEGA